ncbi:TonB-dependent receptor [Sphingobacterium corticis]
MPKHHFNKMRFAYLSISILFSHALLAQNRDEKTDSLKTIQIPITTVIGQGTRDGKRVFINREQLNILQSTTLGETLSRTPSVQNASFGPNAGMPMIRSLSGNRVRVMADGLSLNDLSGITPNINTQIDLENLSGIEIYKAGANVLFGGRAIGGAINLIDNTIPKAVYKKQVQGSAVVEAGTNAGHRESISVKGNAGKRWAWHIGGSQQQHGNLRIPGNTKSDVAYDPNIDHLTADMAQVHVDRRSEMNLTLYRYLSRFVQENINNPEWGLSEFELYTNEPYSNIDGERVQNDPNPLYIAGQPEDTPRYNSTVLGIQDYAPVRKGIMPNSHADSRSVHVGAGYMHNKFRLGMGYKAIEGYYGIPAFAQLAKPKHTHNPAEMVEPTYLPINTRTLSHSGHFEGAYKSDNLFISEVLVRYSYQRGDDRELVGIYRVNKFDSKRHNVRGEVNQQKWRFWSGTTGVDFSDMQIESDGEQRYLPDVSGRELGIFTLQKFDFKRVNASLGYRRDWVARRAVHDEGYVVSRGMAGGKLSDRDFGLHQAAADIRWDISSNFFVRSAASHAERAPDFNELYAGNDHFAILVEENGDDRSPQERALSYEIGVGMKFQNLQLSGSHYTSSFKNYLYLAHTGISRSGGFLVKEWRASDTEISGWEAQLDYHYTWQEGSMLEFLAFFDLVKNRNTSDDDMRQWAEGDFMPNLPTSRYGLSAGGQHGRWMFNASLDRYLKQRFLGKNINLERPMPAYTMVRARVGHRFTILDRALLTYVDCNNLLNAEARPQNSPLKYLAPLPGRNISLGLRMEI